MTPNNPYEKDGKWYWYDETGDVSEPFDTWEKANDDLQGYIAWLKQENLNDPE